MNIMKRICWVPVLHVTGSTCIQLWNVWTPQPLSETRGVGVGGDEFVYFPFFFILHLYLGVMLEITKPAKKYYTRDIYSTLVCSPPNWAFLYLQCNACHRCKSQGGLTANVKMHFSCFMTILSHFGFSISGCLNVGSSITLNEFMNSESTPRDTRPQLHCVNIVVKG